MSRSSPRRPSTNVRSGAGRPALLAGGEVEAVVARGAVQRAGDVVGHDDGVAERALQLRLVVERLADVRGRAAAAVDARGRPGARDGQVEHERIGRHDPLDVRRRRRPACGRPAGASRRRRPSTIELHACSRAGSGRAARRRRSPATRPGRRRRRLHGASRAARRGGGSPCRTRRHRDRAVADVEVGVVGGVRPAPAQVAPPAELAGSGVQQRRDPAAAAGRRGPARRGRPGWARGRRRRRASCRTAVAASSAPRRCSRRTRSPAGCRACTSVSPTGPGAQLAVRASSRACRSAAASTRARQVGAPRLRQRGEARPPASARRPSSSSPEPRSTTTSTTAIATRGTAMAATSGHPRRRVTLGGMEG